MGPDIGTGASAISADSTCTATGTGGAASCQSATSSASTAGAARTLVIVMLHIVLAAWRHSSPARSRWADGDALIFGTAWMLVERLCILSSGSPHAPCLV